MRCCVIFVAKCRCVLSFGPNQIVMVARLLNLNRFSPTLFLFITIWLFLISSLSMAKCHRHESNLHTSSDLCRTHGLLAAPRRRTELGHHPSTRVTEVAMAPIGATSGDPSSWSSATIAPFCVTTTAVACDIAISFNSLNRLHVVSIRSFQGGLSRTPRTFRVALHGRVEQWPHQSARLFQWVVRVHVVIHRTGTD